MTRESDECIILVTGLALRPTGITIFQRLAHTEAFLDCCKIILALNICFFNCGDSLGFRVRALFEPLILVIVQLVTFAIVIGSASTPIIAFLEIITSTISKTHTSK